MHASPTADQNLDFQKDVLSKAGCEKIIKSTAPDFDASSWLPGDVMAGFLNEGRQTSGARRVTFAREPNINECMQFAFGKNGEMD